MSHSQIYRNFFIWSGALGQTGDSLYIGGLNCMYVYIVAQWASSPNLLTQFIVCLGLPDLGPLYSSCSVFTGNFTRSCWTNVGETFLAIGMGTPY